MSGLRATVALPNGLIRPFSIHDVYGRISKRWRARRFKLFTACLQPSASDRILDVGGHYWFWTAPVGASIDTINLDYLPAPANSNIRHTLVGDGCNLPFSDNGYEIAFSNSVIEHVGSWEAQQQFASEIRRVGRTLWVQTPARACPIEPHYLCPFIHWLPRSWQRFLLPFTPWALIHKPSKQDIESMFETIRLLTHSEMKTLFPDCWIYTEKLLGIFPKSYIAIRK